MSKLIRPRHALALVLALLPTPPATAGVPPLVRTPTLELEYETSAESSPLASVRLWYTPDGGASWSFVGEDDDRRSPMSFTADCDGLHGFYFVLSNATGSSGTEPAAGTSPQAAAFVDFTPPVVQLHPPQATVSLGRRVVQVRWSAVDAHFAVRPIELTYRRASEEVWVSVTSEPLANSGRFDWRVPEELTGAVTLLLSATDRVGNRTVSEAHTLDILPLVDAPTTARSETPGAPGLQDSPVDTALHGSAKAKELAAKLLSEAVTFRERGELREAAARLRDAVRLDPGSTEAFVEMGDVLYRLGDADRALNAYELALRRQPAQREALRGAAAAHGQKRDYAAAAKLLRTVLRRNPQDAEVWMNLGDIAIFQGDETLAREAYMHAAQADPHAVQVIAEAKTRLGLLDNASRSYRPSGR